MSKKNIRLLIFGFLILPAACNKSDRFNGAAIPIPSTGLADTAFTDAKVQEMYDRYHIIFRPSFRDQDLTWNWNDRILLASPGASGLFYAPANKMNIHEVIDSVESWVFKTFPLAFTRRYMPLNILMADSTGIRYMLTGNTVYRLYPGYITTNSLLIANVSTAIFGSEKNKRMLRDSWVSLFVEKLYPKIPYPAEFASVSADAYARNADFRFTTDFVAKYGILFSGRRTQNYYLPDADWNETTLQQDFGDFVAFTIFASPEEKQIAYSKNTRVRIKEELVKKYFRNNFSIELTYRPVTP